MTTNNEKETVALGMSGGVDSSIAAHLLLQQGYRVVGVTMQIWDGAFESDTKRSACYGPGEAEDIRAAAEVAARLGIEHHVIPLVEEYRREVLEYFRREYKAGRTPNPCMRCNQAVKFGFLLSKARELGIQFTRFATGHYARVQRNGGGRPGLLRAADPEKDQSYFLARLTPAQLEPLLLPLGDLTKQQVRAIAVELGWQDLAEKHESQDFIESDSYAVLFSPEDAQPGEIRDCAGRVIGEHRGLIHYTIGQRRGVGVSGASHPLYVVGLDQQSNSVTVGPREALLSARFLADDLNWIELAESPREPLGVEVKIRQKSRAAAATISRSGDASAVEVALAEPQLSVTPGQFAVFYRDERVLGSGTISRVLA